MDTLSEVRAAIDEIDDQLIRLLAARFNEVKRAAELKDDPHEARVPWRVEEVTRRVRDACAEHQVNGSVSAVQLWPVAALELWYRAAEPYLTN